MLLRKTLLSLVAVLFLSVGSAAGQSFDTDKLAGMEARNIRPAGISGRVTTITALEDRPDVIYVGTASGGLWRSNDGGTSWTPVFENQAVASIAPMAVSRDDSDVVETVIQRRPRTTPRRGYGRGVHAVVATTSRSPFSAWRSA